MGGEPEVAGDLGAVEGPRPKSREAVKQAPADPQPVREEAAREVAAREDEPSLRIVAEAEGEAPAANAAEPSAEAPQAESREPDLRWVVAVVFLTFVGLVVRHFLGSSH